MRGRNAHACTGGCGTGGDGRCADAGAGGCGGAGAGRAGAVANSNLDGTPHWPNLQLDEVADPILLSWQLGRFDAGTWAHIRRAADCILANGPTSQERWENAEGYSPATIAAEIAGLVCAAAITERNGDADAARRYRDTADDWQRSLPGWTVTTTGPLSGDPYSCA